MPRGAAPQRGEEMAAMEGVLHARRVDPRIPEWLDRIDEAGYVYIDDTEVPLGGLPQALESLPRTGGDGPDITLRADRALDYGRVMAVMGELNRAGLNRISLITNSAAPAAVNNRSSDES